MTLIPVIAWGTTVQRILKTILDASGDTVICTFREDNKHTIEFDSNYVQP